MIQEAYVSFEIAKLLKEKGFKEWCSHCYGTAVTHNGEMIDEDEEYELECEGRKNEIVYVDGGEFYDMNHNNSIDDIPAYAAPTHQMAMAWLREKYHIHIDITIEGNGSYIDYKYVIRDFSIIFPTRNYDSIDAKDGGRAKTYEEAVEAAIKYCLESLI